MTFSAFAELLRIPELRRRMLFTFWALAAYRLGVFITLPGVDRKEFQQFIGRDPFGSPLRLLDTFASSALGRVSIVALGVMPYISATIMISILASSYRPMKEVQRDPEKGPARIEKYTRRTSIALAMVQGISVALYLESLRTLDGVSIVRDPGWEFRLIAMLTLAAGTAFVMWLSDRITEHGIGNGVSMIILAGILSDFPSNIAQILQFVGSGQLELASVFVGAAIVTGSVIAIVYLERAQRRIPIQRATTLIDGRIHGGERSHLVLRVNSGGYIPPIFASSMLALPTTLADVGVPGMDLLRDHLARGDWLYTSSFISLTVFFCFFCSMIYFPPDEVAFYLVSQRLSIPNVRPGAHTARHIEKVLHRVALGGALGVAVICSLPDFLRENLKIPFPIGGVSIMILVQVALHAAYVVEWGLTTTVRGPRSTRELNRIGAQLHWAEPILSGQRPVQSPS